jgi:hypothetical protein
MRRAYAMTSARTAAQQVIRVRLAAKLAPMAFALVAMMLVTGCGTFTKTKAAVSNATDSVTANGTTEFVRCLQSHGIAHPEDVGGRTREELAVPGLSGIYGLRIPLGVEPATFAVAVKNCSRGRLHVGRVAVTGPVLRHNILGLASCLSRNGYSLPAPNFPGPGPVLDVSKVNIASARWVATATGCYVNNQVTNKALERCLGTRGLRGSSETNTVFRQRVLELPRCVKKPA